MMTSKGKTASQTQAAAKVAVWDPFVRFGHWALVAAFAVAYLSAEKEENGPDAPHVWSGNVVGGIVILRVIWGVVGSKHARFSDFVRAPADALRYLAELARGRARRYIGHSPAGGAMVVALLAALAATCVTGVISYGELGKGPLASLGAAIEPARPNAGSADRAFPDARAGKSGKKESVVGELHETVANITLALIGLHILGVVAASFAHRESLVAAMITGRKRAEG